MGWNQYVQPFELNLWSDDREITRLRLWPVRIVVIFFALSVALPELSKAAPSGAAGMAVGISAGYLLWVGILTRLLSVEHSGTGCGADIDDETTDMRAIDCQQCGATTDPAYVDCPECGGALRG